ncbi:orcokinin peptides-like isoform X2 [Pectinophora gossypiella]|uniref:orcokinin peptides-like isoform X2 n=1 Tax=Pectinophora gossypiella TaxID=13191 RepID=UPI00214ED4BC|nr:orcokinin peptides-like isoform X2 [Pectinophora gossypiella]
MKRGSGGAVVVAVAALLVCCSADPHQDQDLSAGEHNSADRYDANGHKTRNLDPLGGGHLIRQVREVSHFPGLLPYMAARRHNSLYENDPFADYAGYYDLQKRNFDEIDRSELNPFIGKRNFDEIDQTSMPFPYATKRFYHLYGNNYLDYPVEGFRSSSDKKRLRPDYPMDEIDLSHFPIGSKRSSDSFDRWTLVNKRRQAGGMDEIDASHFPVGSRRSDLKKRLQAGGMDEIDASHFPLGSRRSLARR